MLPLDLPATDVTLLRFTPAISFSTRGLSPVFAGFAGFTCLIALPC